MTQLSRESRALLTEARRLERTSDADRARIRSKLSHRLAAGLAVGTAVTASATVAEAARVGAWATAVAWLPATAKVISVAVIAGAVSMGTVNLVQTGSIVGHAEAPAVSRNLETSAAPANKNAVTQAAPVVPAAPEVPATPPEVIAPRPPAAPVVQQARTAAAKPLARESSQPAAVPEPSPVADAPAPAGDSLSNQVSAIREARTAIRNGNAPAALAALDRQFPPGQNSSLLPEATLARIAALCALGDAAGARQVADGFLSRFPGSVLASRVHASCAYPVTNGQ